jgi:hypothetical protein
MWLQDRGPKQPAVPSAGLDPAVHDFGRRSRSDKGVDARVKPAQRAFEVV